ncbi:oxygenase MpaB family protein [Micromonospora sp. WMMD882]|uniref:oxygenase MpaB family protein n=1 Tax=Micromonospora sp. WMMD882 TaxID=3015151 RepID=UPI00248C3217|nr:oxygenase MpaB family protein [Micromonospora sp. WMMD882]WBB77627.1 oxygenase MpaB family protein [Micromonospora sp. WMMD882]
MDSDDLGLFGPGSVTWRVHEEPVLLVAGLRALYLQALHPRAMAGVAQNSNYRHDAWGRLLRTATYVATTVYGTSAEAEQAGSRLRALHARLSAVDPASGERFRVDEPDLLRWVHVTEVESFVSTARRAGLGLTADEVDGYYTEQRRAAALVGLDPATVPGTAAEIDAYYRRIRPELRMTREAAETAVFLTAPPLPWKLSLPARLGVTLGPPRWAYLGIAGTALGLLPPWAQRLYGGLGLPTTALSAQVGVRALRLALATVPRRYLEGPIIHAAKARAARHAAAQPTPPARQGQETPARSGPA